MGLQIIKKEAFRVDGNNKQEKIEKLKNVSENIAGKENEEKIKKGGIRLTGKIIAIVSAIIVIIAVAILSIVLINMSKLSSELTEDKLQATVFAVQSHYDSLSNFGYKIGADGNLYKGTTNLIYEKEYIEKLRNDMNTYTGMFFEDKIYISSFLNSDGSECKEIELSKEAKAAVEKNGTFFDDGLVVNGVSYYCYYKAYSTTEDGEINGIMVVAVDKKATTKLTVTIITYVALAIVIIMAIAIACLMVFIRMIVKVIRISVGDMESVSQGYLNFNVTDKVLKRRDEIGDMANGIQQVINNFKSVVTKIFEASDELTKFTENYSNSFTKINETMHNVNIAVEEIANGATSQADETMNANSEMTNMGGAIDDASLNVDSLGESSSKMTGYSNQARNTLEELGTINEKTIRSVNVVQNQTNLTNKSALEIQQATELIADIASQTNLLSLNASIEAARAGENGRGFAVVADEIRNLADQSRISAEKIAEIVTTLISNSNESVDTMNDVMKIMEVQSSKLDDTKEMFASLDDEIASVNNAILGIKNEMNNLNDLKDVVLGSLENLAAIAEENAASTEETSAAMSELSDIIETCDAETKRLMELAEGLDNSIRTFKL